jgi:outer membrane protein assembly factor BamB
MRTSAKASVRRWAEPLGSLCLRVIVVLSVMTASPVGAEDWPLGRANQAGTGATADSLPSDLELLWEVSLDGLGFDAGPVIADGKVYAADADGRVTALNLATGEELWSISTAAGFMASPAFHDGTLYVGDLEGKFLALDAATGKKRWEFPAEMEIDGSPNFFEELVLFTSQSGSLYALDRTDGNLKWKYDTGDQLQCGATLSEDRTFLGGCDGFLHVVDVKQGVAIGSPLPIDSPTGSTPSVAEGLIFLPTHAGEIIAFQHPSNEVAWRFKNEELASEFKNSVAIADGLLVATSRNRRVFALDVKSGQLKWETTLRKRADASPIIAGAQVVVAAADGRIVLLNLKDGAEQWMFEVKGGFLGSPAASDGKLVVASDRGTIFCFGSKSADGSSTEASSTETSR